MKVAKCIRDYPTDKHSFIAAGQQIQFMSDTITCGSVPVTPGNHPHFFEISEVPDGPWKPKDREPYFAIHSDGIVIEAIYNDSPSSLDFRRFAFGNGFQTKGQAESKLPAVRAALSGEQAKDLSCVLNSQREVLAEDFRGYLCGMASADSFATKAINRILAAWESR